MKKLLLILSCLFVASCTTTKQVYISDIDAERKISIKTTKLERIVSGNNSKDAALHIAVLVGIDKGNRNYVAIAPSPHDGFMSVSSIVDLDKHHIRSLEIDEAKKLLRAINFAVNNFDTEVPKLQSLNSSYYSYLQSGVMTVQNGVPVVVLSDYLIFTFVNDVDGAAAQLSFINPNIVYQSTMINLYIGLDKDELKHLNYLLSKAINRAIVAK